MCRSKSRLCTRVCCKYRILCYVDYLSVMQTTMTKLLFICTENKLRSLTAEDVFSRIGGISAIGCGTNKDADTPLSGDLIQWADVIFPMESVHLKKLKDRFPQLLKGKKVVCLDVKDKYEYMQPELVALLKENVRKHYE